MEREILFKAKSLETGEWVTGNYAYGKQYRDLPGVHFISEPQPFEKRLGVDPSDKNNPKVVSRYYIESKVNPDTLCEYTNRKLECGIKLFEGDILLEDTESENAIRYTIDFNDLQSLDSLIKDHKMYVVGNKYD